MKGGFAFEESGPPLVIARLWGTLTDEEFRSYLRGYEAIMAHGRRVVVLIDARAADPAPAGQRKLQAEWLAAHEEEVRSLLMGMAFVLSSPVVRAIITAVFWLKPLPCPHVITGTMQEAFAWASDTCAGHGVTLPRPSSAPLAHVHAQADAPAKRDPKSKAS